MTSDTIIYPDRLVSPAIHNAELENSILMVVSCQQSSDSSLEVVCNLSKLYKHDWSGS